MSEPKHEPLRTIGHDDYCSSNNYDPGNPEYTEQCDCHWRFFAGMDPAVVQEMVEFVRGAANDRYDIVSPGTKRPARAILAKLEAGKEAKKDAPGPVYGDEACEACNRKRMEKMSEEVARLRGERQP